MLTKKKIYKCIAKIELPKFYFLLKAQSWYDHLHLTFLGRVGTCF